MLSLTGPSFLPRGDVPDRISQFVFVFAPPFQRISAQPPALVSCFLLLPLKKRVAYHSLRSHDNTACRQSWLLVTSATLKQHVRAPSSYRRVQPGSPFGSP